MNRWLISVLAVIVVAATSLVFLLGDRGASHLPPVDAAPTVSPQIESNTQERAIQDFVDEDFVEETESTTPQVESPDLVHEPNVVYSYEDGRHLLTKDQRRTAVRRYFLGLARNDASANALLESMRDATDEGTWSGPVRAVMSDTLEQSDPEKFAAGDVYVECGGYLCAITGIDEEFGSKLTHDLGDALIKQNADIVVGNGWPTEEHGWVTFVASPEFLIPSSKSN